MTALCRILTVGVVLVFAASLAVYGWALALPAAGAAVLLDGLVWIGGHRERR